MLKIFICCLIIFSCNLYSNNFKDENFIAGIALKDFGFPGWAKKYTASTLDAVRNSAAKWVSVHYFNSYTSTGTPTIASSYKSDGYSSNQAKLDEYKYVIQEAKKRGYKICLISSLFFGEMLGGLSVEEEVALNESLYIAHSNDWYDNWFNSYKERLTELANLANESGVDMLALGWNITYVTGDVKGSYDVTSKWKEIINDLRKIYKGKIILPETTNGYDNNYLKGIEGLFNDLDYISLHLTMDGLKGFSGKKYIEDIDEIKTTFKIIFSTFGFSRYYQYYGKKTIIFTTVTSSTRCFEGVWFEEMVEQPGLIQDFDAQKNVYQAMFDVLSSTDWIGGTFPWGYWWKDDFYKNEDGNNTYSFDKGASIRKKPSEEVVYNFYSVEEKKLLLNTTTYYEIFLNNKNSFTKIIIPEGTFNQNVNITISTLSTSGITKRTTKGDAQLTNIGIEIKTDLDLQPSKGIVIETYYKDSDIEQITNDESKLTFVMVNEETNFLDEIKSIVNSDYNQITTTTTHLSKFVIILPSQTNLSEAKVVIYPNPFNPHKNLNVTIKYYPADATATVYNLSGELVTSLVYDSFSGKTTWDGKNSGGNMVASGIYFVLIKTNTKSATGKIAVIK